MPEHESRLANHSWRVRKVIQRSARDFDLYFHRPAFLPSFAGALLYLTVLSFAGQMVTYLLSAGYNATQIGVVRTLSVVFEVLATWLAPWLMERIGPIRAGIWLASWQMICLVAGMAVFWAFFDRPTISASGLVGGTILSRIGLRGFDLCTQIIIQEVSHLQLLFHSYRSSICVRFPLAVPPRLTELCCTQDVEAAHRGSFSSVEAAWQNAFELCSYVSTVIFSRPEQFNPRSSASSLWSLQTHCTRSLFMCGVVTCCTCRSGWSSCAPIRGSSSREYKRVEKTIDDASFAGDEEYGD
jgi:iron-regulated transporter 1